MSQLVSFYSYKGGVGRSLALSNVAVFLAQRGRRVICIDFDLEAGGLHTIFGLDSKDVKVSLLDMLTFITPPDAKPSLIDLTSKIPDTSKKGSLLLLPTISESRKVREVLDVGRDLPMLLGGIISQINDIYNPHYILVDCRSGFAELASVPILKTDKLVCVMRPNRQNVDGLRILLDILENIPEAPKTFLALSQVPIDPDIEVKVKKILAKLEEQLGEERKFMAHIPYDPMLSLEEIVVAITAPQSSLAKKYIPIVDWLENDEV